MTFPSTHSTRMTNLIAPSIRAADQRICDVGAFIVRYGLVLVIAWIGALKLFTSTEAERIQPLVSNSPFMSWMNSLFSERGVSDVIGVIELLVALLIVVRHWLPAISAVGSALAILLFLGTLSFLFTTPGVADAGAGGFPALSMSGQFILKDLVPLGASVWTLGEALRATRSS